MNSGRLKNLLLAMACVLIWEKACATLYFTDHFSYTDGADLGATSGGGGSIWSLASGDVTQIKTAASATQTSVAGYAAASGLGVDVIPTGTRKQTGVPFNGTTGVPVADGNVVYASFLLNVQTLPSANLRVAYMHSGAASQGGIEVVVSSTGQVGIQKKGSGTTFVSGTPVASAGTHLVIMRYTFQSGNDEVAVWVDPSSANYGANTAPTSGAYAATTGGGSDMSSAITYFIIDAPAVTGPVFWIDEVRVGTTWADVTPSSNQVILPAVPIITQALLSQQGMILRGSNGPVSSSYQVIASTSFTQPVSNWPAIASHAFDLNGNFDSTNPVTPGLGQQFFRILVGGTNASAGTAPTITNQPQSLAVASGNSASFSVGATGSTPLTYQWYFNTNTVVANATSATLTINPVNATNAGTYSVVVGNSFGSVTSSIASLTVFGPPVIMAEPQSETVAVSNSAIFTVATAGSTPLTYAWFLNTNTPVGGNSSVLSLSNVQSNNAGAYTVIITNTYGAVTSSPAVLTVSAAITNSAQFNLVGFGQATVGGGIIAETNPAYAKVTTPMELANAVLAFNKTGSIKVIEIMNDLDLGWNEIGSNVQNLASTPFTAHNPPQLHPRLLVTGVSKMDIKYKNGGLTIFSANGATIRHCTFNIKSTHDIIVRNLKFDEMWEWDEATKGQYDQNDWDFIDLANGGDVYNVWIDHCTFTKTYDGIVDFKAGSTNVTVSWCRYTGDDGATNANSWVWQQITSLESNKNSYAFYGFLRNNGFSTTDIVQIVQGHDKTHLMGANDLDPNNVNLSATFHHLWMKNCWDRAVPRLRAGNVHDFNILVDDTDALAAKRLRDARQAAMSPSSSNTLQNTYSFNPPLNGSISTEGGAVLVEKSVYIDCLYPLRNNQTDPTNPQYTGKILGLDMIYQMDSTVVRGNSTDSGSPLGPFQAPIISFSWNPASGAPNGQLPYSYTPDDPSQLQSILSSPTSGTGAGVLTWDKSNWLKTSY